MRPGSIPCRRCGETDHARLVVTHRRPAPATLARATARRRDPVTPRLAHRRAHGSRPVARRRDAGGAKELRRRRSGKGMLSRSARLAVLRDADPGHALRVAPDAQERDVFADGRRIAGAWRRRPDGALRWEG